MVRLSSEGRPLTGNRLRPRITSTQLSARFHRGANITGTQPRRKELDVKSTPVMAEEPVFGLPAGRRMAPTQWNHVRGSRLVFQSIVGEFRIWS